MSRVGKKIISIPKDVTVTLTDSDLNTSPELVNIYTVVNDLADPAHDQVGRQARPRAPQPVRTAQDARRSAQGQQDVPAPLHQGGGEWRARGLRHRRAGDGLHHVRFAGDVRQGGRRVRPGRDPRQ